MVLTEPQVIDSQATQPVDQQVIALTHRPRRLRCTDLRRMVCEMQLARGERLTL